MIKNWCFLCLTVYKLGMLLSFIVYWLASFKTSADLFCTNNSCISLLSGFEHLILMSRTRYVGNGKTATVKKATSKNGNRKQHR